MSSTKRKPLRERPLVGKKGSALARGFIVYVSSQKPKFAYTV